MFQTDVSNEVKHTGTKHPDDIVPVCKFALKQVFHNYGMDINTNVEAITDSIVVCSILNNSCMSASHHSLALSA